MQIEAVEVLREAIISGKLPIGSHLPEAELADQMAVSRIPIREALRQLEQEGLVIRQPNRGCFVITFTEHDVKEVFSLRSMIESMAFEWAQPHLTREDFAELRRLVDQQVTAIHQQDFEDLAELDMKFHEYICLKANHSRLLKEWYAQHAQCQILLNLRFRTFPDYTPETVIDDHHAILDALERSDVKTAVKLTLEISERVSAECIETLRTLEQQAEPERRDRPERLYRAPLPATS
jgi:DNA-binding GntR family transcriptional regulator